MHKKIKLQMHPILQMHFPTKFKSLITKLSTHTTQWELENKPYKPSKFRPLKLEIKK
jgi:hypothetical protein